MFDKDIHTYGVILSNAYHIQFMALLFYGDNFQN